MFDTTMTLPKGTAHPARIGVLLPEQTAPAIPKAALRALTELTGQIELGPALLITLKDAIEHRLSVIGVQIRAYENQYGMNFEQFQSSGRSGELQAPTSYRIERDYFEWDSLITRRKKLNDILQWLA